MNILVLHPGTTVPPGMEWSQTNALQEDIFLRGFPPLIGSHQQLLFDATNYADILEQVTYSATVLLQESCI